MEFRILGPLEVEADGRLLALGPRKQRDLLALLLMQTNGVVSRDHLIDALWGEHPPETAATALHGYVSGLRKVLGPDRIETRAPGYLLHVTPDEVDLERFERLLAEARGLEPWAAAARFREALSLWCGPMLADLDDAPFLETERLRLEELRLAVVEERIDADLALGRHSELIAELDTLVRDHPLREGLRCQQMVALYRSGRQAEALETYHQARSTLVGELGLEPGPALQQLERQILRHDPALQAPVTARRSTVRIRSRQVAVLTAVALLVLASAAIAVALTRGDASPAPVVAAPNTIGVIDAGSNRLVARIPVGTHPVGIAYRGRDVWVANTEDDTVSSIDPETRQVKTVGIGTPPTDVVFAGKNVWTGNGSDGTLAEISPVVRKFIGGTDLSGKQSLIRNSVNALAAGGSSLWAAMSNGDLIRVSPRTHRILERFHVGSVPLAIGYGGGAAWVLNANNHLLRLEPGANEISGDRLVGYPIAGSIATAGAHVFVGVQPTISGDQLVEMLDAGSMQPEWTSAVRGPVAIAVGRGAVWVASGFGNVYRLDRATGRVIRRIQVGGAPRGIAVVRDEVWVTIDAPEY